MELYKIGICDDEKRILQINHHYLKQIDIENDEYELELINFIKGKDIVEYIKRNPLDIAILDIDVIDMSGLEIAKELQKINPKIILFFITGHDEFAIDAFDVDAVGYVLKPVDIDKLKRTLNKAIERAKKIREHGEEKELVITEDNIKKKIKLSEIVYIERTLAQCAIVTTSKTFKVYDTITALMDKVGEGFVRVSQSYIVKTSAIDRVTYKSVTLKNGMEISLGRAYTKGVKKAFLEATNKYS